MLQNKNIKNNTEIGKDDKRFIEIARNLIKKNPEVFEALMDFERTKKLPKLSRKERINLTIDSALLKKFRDYCRTNNKVMSKIIEEKIKEELGKKALN